MKRRKLLKHLQKFGCVVKEGAKHTRVFKPRRRTPGRLGYKRCSV